MHPVNVDIHLVKRLITTQFPHWAHLEVTAVEPGGHDNHTFRLGQEMVVRLPRGRSYADHLVLELQWLPILARPLSLSIPEPLAQGEPAADYPWPWCINRWIPGEPASTTFIANLRRFIRDLVRFIVELQAIPAASAPSPGKHNFYRGGPLAVYDEETRACLVELEGLVDTTRAARVWEEALSTRWNRPPVWVHGDMAADNLLVRDGRLSAVIDFGQLAAGDPACDMAIAWTFLPRASRDTFREALCIDDETWVRGRGWALWKALLQLRVHHPKHPRQVKAVQQVIREILL